MPATDSQKTDLTQFDSSYNSNDLLVPNIIVIAKTSPNHYIFPACVERVKKSEQPPFRPSVTAWVDEDCVQLVDLMKFCWEDGPQHRPSFEVVQTIWKKMNKGG